MILHCASCGDRRPPGTLISSHPDPGEGQQYPSILVCADRDLCRRRTEANIQQLPTGATQP